MGFTDKLSLLRRGLTNTELIQMNRLQISLGQEKKETNTRVQRGAMSLWENQQTYRRN